MKTLRFGIIGTGWVVRSRHLPALATIPGVQTRLIWSRTPEKAREVAKEFGVPNVANDWRDVIGSPEVDAVIVATPPVLHLPATLAALDAGKHVLCQARMARNLGEAREMLRAARASRLVTALYPARPGLKGDRVKRRLLHEEHFVGDIREVRVTALELTEVKEGYEWALDTNVVGVNTMTLGMWAEVLNRWLGPAKRVAAVGQTQRRQQKGVGGQSTERAVVDSLAVVAELQCGVTASYHFSACAAKGPGHFIEVYGSRGALVYQLFGDEIRGAGAPGQEFQPIPISPEEARSQTTDADFVRAIREGTPVSPSFVGGVAYMGFCEAVAQSVKTGAFVAVPPSG